MVVLGFGCVSGVLLGRVVVRVRFRVVMSREVFIRFFCYGLE